MLLFELFKQLHENATLAEYSPRNVEKSIA